MQIHVLGRRYRSKEVSIAQNVFLCEAGGGGIILVGSGNGADNFAVPRVTPGDYDTDGSNGIARGAEGNPPNLEYLEAPNFRWLSKPYTPAGETAICLFRRLYFAIRHNAGFSIAVKAWVDGQELKEQDQEWDITLGEWLGGTTQTEEILVDASTGTGTVIEYVEVPIHGRGTSIQVLLQTIESSNGKATIGEFSLEGFAIGYRRERGILMDNAEV